LKSSNRLFRASFRGTIHITVSKDPNAALSSPAVEFVAFTLKDGASAEKFSALMEELGKGLDVAAGAHPPSVWGQSIEEKNKYLLVVGWDTVEVGVLHAFDVGPQYSHSAVPLGSGQGRYWSVHNNWADQGSRGPHDWALACEEARRIIMKYVLVQHR
jgi:hypothetical protein